MTTKPHTDPDTLPPVLVVATADSLSIRAGHIYQFREYRDSLYARYGESPPKRREGTLEGVGHCVPPCCVGYPKHLTKPFDPEPPAELEWL